MGLFRKKLLVAWFFALVSFGQAYPYSYALTLDQHAECGCNLSGRKCIHGCDLKKHHHAPGHGPAAMGHAGHFGHHGQFVQGDDETATVWVNPDCSQQKRREVLDFRGDPFLPQVQPQVVHPERMSFAIEAPLHHAEGIARLEVPPPKA
ncbi:MAG: hypothetical protein U1F66_10460 [bacterium]